MRSEGKGGAYYTFANFSAPFNRTSTSISPALLFLPLSLALLRVCKYKSPPNTAATALFLGWRVPYVVWRLVPVPVVGADIDSAKFPDPDFGRGGGAK
jgi:hypothetical protein